MNIIKIKLNGNIVGTNVFVWFVHFLAIFGGSGVSLVVETVLRAIDAIVDVVPFKTTAGLNVRREIDVTRLTAVACWMVGVFAEATLLPIVRFEMPGTARRTNETFDVAVAELGRSTLFALVIVTRDASTGVALVFAGNLAAMLPRLARRFNVDKGGRTKIHLKRTKRIKFSWFERTFYTFEMTY